MNQIYLRWQTQYLQNKTTRLSTFPISVLSVLAVTSSISSSSSPVDLFSINHSNTSSSFDNSPVFAKTIPTFIFQRSSKRRIDTMKINKDDKTDLRTKLEFGGDNKPMPAMFRDCIHQPVLHRGS